MTNAEWLAWFDRQSREIRRRTMDTIDVLENSHGIQGILAHELAMTHVLSGVPVARLADVVKH